VRAALGRVGFTAQRLDIMAQGFSPGWDPNYRTRPERAAETIENNVNVCCYTKWVSLCHSFDERFVWD
jgi:hypothetical protein